MVIVLEKDIIAPWGDRFLEGGSSGLNPILIAWR
jgi:hypothetical protein